jgi:hypothetical protein
MAILFAISSVWSRPTRAILANKGDGRELRVGQRLINIGLLLELVNEIGAHDERKPFADRWVI